MSDKDKSNSVEMCDVFEFPVFKDQTQSPVVKAMMAITRVVDGPVEWIRANIVERFRGPKYYYYHQKFHRVPTIDQCYTDDHACIWEANEQYKRDKKVDEQIRNVLSHRYYNCMYYERNVNEYHNAEILCLKEKGDFRESQINFFIKYGDIGSFSNVVDAFMKQKHRLIWERRHGQGIQSQEVSN